MLTHRDPRSATFLTYSRHDVLALAYGERQSNGRSSPECAVRYEGGTVPNKW